MFSFSIYLRDILEHPDSLLRHYVCGLTNLEREFKLGLRMKIGTGNIRIMIIVIMIIIMILLVLLLLKTNHNNNKQISLIVSRVKENLHIQA